MRWPMNFAIFQVFSILYSSVCFAVKYQLDLFTGERMLMLPFAGIRKWNHLMFASHARHNWSM
jgi:hypothetical protein